MVVRGTSGAASRISRVASARIAGVLIVSVGLLATAACSTSDASGPPSTVTKTVTAATSAAAASAPSGAAARPDAGTLARSFDRAIGTSMPGAGLAIVAVGRNGGTPVVVGNRTTQVAWSTIKVPLAIAAQRANGQSAAATAAIVNSDNDAATTLWNSLGSPTEAAAAVTGVLREGGDSTTQVPSRQLRPPFTIFGQTPWPLPQAAEFAAHLPCMAGTEQVLSLMGRVAGNQQWGAEIMSQAKSTAVKGGWGPGVGGGYLVRQVGVITFRDGRQAGVAMSSVGGSMSDGIATLNAMANWLNRNIAALPRGACR
ncbi:hypothetical protein GCM10009624_20480 [Gordonia sinesedis]